MHLFLNDFREKVHFASLKLSNIDCERADIALKNRKNIEYVHKIEIVHILQ